MSDSEGEWKPKGRPQSTMARTFSAALDDAFMLDSEVDNLSQSVQQKQHLVTIQNRELEALEARIREAEERLKTKSTSPSPEQDPSNGRTQGLGGAFSDGDGDRQQARQQAQSQLTSPAADSHPTGQTSAGSSGSATNSRDANDGASRQNRNGEGGGREP